MNRISSTMLEELLEVLGSFDSDSEVRCIVLTGTGERAFCVGADMTEFQSLVPSTALDAAMKRREILGHNLYHETLSSLGGYWTL